MNTQRFFGNPQFLTYARLLRQLHQLIRGGADETEKGEALRNQMDEPGEYLTQEEVDCVGALSADFYTLSGSPLALQHNPPSSLRDELREALRARDSGEFAKALDLVRKNEAYLQPAVAAYFRGSTWASAGEHDIAVDFFQRATELAPQNGNYAYVWLDALSRANADEALKVADRLLRKPTDHAPQLVLKAAEVVFLSRRQITKAQPAEVARWLIPIFEDLVVWMETSGETKASPSLMCGVIGYLGICYMEIGNSETARRWFSRGLQLFPNNEVLLTIRGIYLYGIDPEGSLQDFRQAIQQRSRLAWPYFFLAHYYLVRDQYAECLNMAQRAQSLATSDALRADCLEWIAISQANLGYPPESVSAAFHVAQQLAPNNQRIAKNRQLFDNSVAGTAPSEIQWERPAPEAVQSLGQQVFQPDMEKCAVG